MNAFVTRFLTFEKKFVHGAASLLVAGALWWVAHPDQVATIVKTYPRAAILTTAAGFILALYTQVKPGVSPPSP